MNNIFLAIIYIIVFKLCAKVQKNIEKKVRFCFFMTKTDFIWVFLYTMTNILVIICNKNAVIR
ncbi:MAG: hypothetical protein EGQ31_00445 [Prevotella sp.]|nr:hypothetical protein [Prevotella sp.]